MNYVRIRQLLCITYASFTFFTSSFPVIITCIENNSQHPVTLALMVWESEYKTFVQQIITAQTKSANLQWKCPTTTTESLTSHLKGATTPMYLELKTKRLSSKHKGTRLNEQTLYYFQDATFNIIAGNCNTSPKSSRKEHGVWAQKIVNNAITSYQCLIDYHENLAITLTIDENGCPVILDSISE